MFGVSTGSCSTVYGCPANVSAVADLLGSGMMGTAEEGRRYWKRRNDGRRVSRSRDALGDFLICACCLYLYSVYLGPQIIAIAAASRYTCSRPR